MKRFAALGAGLFLLGGCALPVPVQIASWALDGISYMLTEKSVADHGISMLAQKDCAVLRGLMESGEFCRDFDDTATVLAEGMPYDSLFDDDDTLSAEVAAITEFEVAGGGVDAAASRVSAASVLERAALNAFPQRVVVEATAPQPAAKPDVPKELPARTTQVMENGQEPAVGYYFVIGSFRNQANARSLRNQFRALKPSVLSAKLDVNTVYRVVVGPYVKIEEKDVHNEIFRAGIADSWTIQVKPGDWRTATVNPPAVVPPVEVAGVARPVY